MLENIVYKFLGMPKFLNYNFLSHSCVVKEVLKASNVDKKINLDINSKDFTDIKVNKKNKLDIIYSDEMDKYLEGKAKKK